MGQLTGSNESDKIPLSAMSDSVPMLDDVNKLPTSHAVFTVESALISLINSKPDAQSQSSVVRTLNSVFQVSTARAANVRYSVTISNTVSLTGGAAGLVILEIATNTGFTTGVQELGRISNSNTGSLVVGLVLTDAVTLQLNGHIPIGCYVRLRTSNTTGTPVYTFQTGQEILV